MQGLKGSCGLTRATDGGRPLPGWPSRPGWRQPATAGGEGHWSKGWGRPCWPRGRGEEVQLRSGQAAQRWKEGSASDCGVWSGALNQGVGAGDVHPPEGRSGQGGPRRKGRQWKETMSRLSPGSLPLFRLPPPSSHLFSDSRGKKQEGMSHCCLQKVVVCLQRPTAAAP